MMQFPQRLQTERLTLRRPEPQDDDVLATFLALPAWWRHSSAGEPPSHEVAAGFGPFIREHWARFGCGFFAIDRDGEILGTCGLKFVGTGPPAVFPDRREALEIGYGLVDHACGCGYVTEAARAVTATAADVDLSSVLGRCAGTNSASIKTLERLGFQFERESSLGVRRSLVYRLDLTSPVSPK